MQNVFKKEQGLCFVRYFLIVFLSAAQVLLPMQVAANPNGAVVQEGNVKIVQENVKKLGIHQYTDKAIVNWKSFDIKSDEHTQFYQPSSSSLILNRITSQNPSSILGKLTANGRVMIINHNGILFGKNAQIDTAGLVASIHDIKNRDFMAGNYQFSIPGNPNAEIVNNGSITIKHGGIASFVAPTVRNHGVIVAKLGKVCLASADKFTLDLYGDGLINFVLDESSAKQTSPSSSKTLPKGVENSGTIVADGGHVLLTASAARGVIDSVVNSSGTIQARSIKEVGGQIVLGGENAAKIIVAGSLDASGKDDREKGGYVEVVGKETLLPHTARIDVSGDAGGGTALIGGDYLGGRATPEQLFDARVSLENRTVPNAKYTTVDYGATINADAIRSGNGGKIIVWSDDTTKVAAKISARGGMYSGDGGFVETSGKIKLEFNSSVIASALNGQNGLWLLDPVTMNIGATEALNYSHSLNTGTDVTINAKYIHLKADIEKTHGNDAELKLFADSGIYLNHGKRIYSESGELDVILDSDRDDTGGGLIRINTAKVAGQDVHAISTNGGDVKMYAWDLIAQGMAVESLGGDITLKHNNDYATWFTIGSNNANYYTIDAGTGDVDVLVNAAGWFDDADLANFVELHNHAIRGDKVVIDTALIRNIGHSYSWDSPDYSYNLPAFDNDDSTPEINARKLTIKGGADKSLLDFQVLTKEEFKSIDNAQDHLFGLRDQGFDLGILTTLVGSVSGILKDAGATDLRAFNGNADWTKLKAAYKISRKTKSGTVGRLAMVAGIAIDAYGIITAKTEAEFVNQVSDGTENLFSLAGSFLGGKAGVAIGAMVGTSVSGVGGAIGGVVGGFWGAFIGGELASAGYKHVFKEYFVDIARSYYQAHGPILS